MTPSTRASCTRTGRRARTSGTTRRSSTSSPRSASTGTQAAAVIAEGRYADRIAASTQEANRLGIYAIPAFILGGRLVVMGAQPEELFEQAVEQLSAAAQPPSGDMNG